MSKHAIIAVDIQNDYFAEGKWPLVGIENAAANAAKVIEHARQAGVTVIHVRHEFPMPQALFFVPDTAGAEINSVVAPLQAESVVVKNYPNSFLKTDLKEILDKHGVEEVVVIGAMSHMCIEATSRAASDFGYQVTVVHDACATCDLEFNEAVIPAAQVHATAMAALGFAYAGVKSTAEYLS